MAQQRRLFNGWVKYWPIIVACVLVISGYAVLCNTVADNKTRSLSNQLSNIAQDKIDVIREEQYKHILINQTRMEKKVDSVDDKIEAVDQKIETLRTQITEALRTR